MSGINFVDKLEEIGANYSTHFPLVILNSGYRIDKGIVIFGKKGWLRINDPIPIMLSYNTLILLDTPKKYMFGTYKKVRQGRKFKNYSRAKAPQDLNTGNKIIRDNDNNNTTNEETSNATETNSNQTQQHHTNG
ncbi:hypothetical protein [Acidianus bottle-shaped virus 2 strain ABV2]|uniref:Uncharacterized protein n=1 Tax=Acidianus bottle-shaped virus 2 strain ABV2 TaxID=1732173 RepID=A0A0N9P969_9VIRU|nr:hypothetical protein AVU01_gp53 [Acidianus bottle-shaped virus 2 strain ABV2]ALG96801.1 hypothetical protein [Acidianus bottle-shaped virus 2 strain ABV2]